jgi:uncharacterized protein (UPF0261 family)
VSTRCRCVQRLPRAQCNFGPRDTVPERYRGRTLHEHNPSVTLMRTSAAECRAIGRVLADRVGRAQGRTALLIPRQGWSMLDRPGGPFWDPEADAALVGELKKGLQGSQVEVLEVDANVNDEAFVRACVDKLLETMGEQ